MEKTLLNTKWLGTICVVAVAFIFSFLASNYASTAIRAFMPTFVTEASQFLPITVEKGTIVEPKDTQIKKNYGTADSPFVVMLDTNADELTSADLTAQGLYISRKFIYGVKSDKTEVWGLDKLSDMTINQELLQQGAEWVEQKSGGYAFAILFISILLYIPFAILLYAAVIQLIIGMALKVGFGRTLRVTTLGYLALFVIGAFTVSIGIIVTFILLLGANWLTAKYYPQSTAEAA